MQRKVLQYHGPIDLHAAAFLYEDIIHTHIPFVSRALNVNAENVYMKSVFGKKMCVVDIANPFMRFVYLPAGYNPLPGRAVHFSEGQDPMYRQVEIIDTFRYNPSVGFWKFHLTLPVARERAIYAMKTGENEYEITLEADSRRDLARMERLLYDTLDEETSVRNG